MKHHTFIGKHILQATVITLAFASFIAIILRLNPIWLESYRDGLLSAPPVWHRESDTSGLYALLRYIWHWACYQLGRFEILEAAACATYWAVFLYKIDLFEKEKWRYLFLAFACGAVSPYLFIDMLHTSFPNLFIQPREPLSMFSYYFFQVAFLEEMTKLIPFLLIYRFTREVNEPIDFIIFAAFIALGFSFSENVGYYQSPLYSNVHFGEELMIPRTLFATIGHCFDASVWSYFFWKATVKKDPFSLYTLPLIGFLLSCLTHGTYDWLLAMGNKSVVPGLFLLIWILGFLASLYLWTLMKNEMLIASPFYNPTVKLNLLALFIYLIYGLSVLILIQFTMLSLKQDDYSFIVLGESLILGYLVLALFFSARLGQIDTRLVE